MFILLRPNSAQSFQSFLKKQLSIRIWSCPLFVTGSGGVTRSSFQATCRSLSSFCAISSLFYAGTPHEQAYSGLPSRCDILNIVFLEKLRSI